MVRRRRLYHLKCGTIPDERFDHKQLLKGMAVEREHTNSRVLAKEIAKGHLCEHPSYYEVLDAAERRMSKLDRLFQ